MGVWNQSLDHVQTRGTGENSVSRLELAHFELNLILFGLTDIGRIGNDEVEFSARQAGE